MLVGKLTTETRSSRSFYQYFSVSSVPDLKNRLRCAFRCDARSSVRCTWLKDSPQVQRTWESASHLVFIP
jgi:hypothetical protein